MTEQPTDDTRPLPYIAALLGLSERRVNQLADQGVIPKTDRGRYDLRATVSAYMDYLRKAARRGRSVKGDAEPDGGDGDAEQKADLRLKLAKAEQEEIKLEQMRGESHSADEVERELSKMLGAFRTRCLALPTKLAPLIVNETNPAAVQAVLKTGIHECLSELADYDPDKFASPTN